MLRDLLQMDLLKLRCYFNEDTCQVAYLKSMKPGDHGYVKGMEGYYDLENDMCICRSFDNALMPLKNKYGFKGIVPDDTPSHLMDKHIKISEVRRILNLAQRPDKLAKLSGKIYIKETKGNSSKIVVKVDELESKKHDLMVDLIKSVENLKGGVDLSDSVFEITSIVRKNLFTKEELKDFLNKTK